MLKAQNTIKITISTLLVIGSAICCYSQKPSTAAESQPELAIERVGPPEFNAENDVVVNISPEEKEIAEEMTPIISLIGDTRHIENNKEAVKNLSSIIEKHPEYSDAYFLRAMASILAKDGNYPQVLSDVDAAINLHSDHKYLSMYDSNAPMYSLRTKVDLLAGDYSRAMNDLEAAIKVDPSNEGDVFNTGGVKPEENGNPTALQKKDLESFVARYPRDYRSFLFRGLFYASFTAYDEQYYAPALRDLEQARKLSPTSSMVSYFLGTLYQKQTYWTKAGAADISNSAGGYREKTSTVALQYFELAVKLDPKFVEAQAEVAETLFRLKRYRGAIPIYDNVIALDPNRFGAYNDRGLAKTYTNDYYGAISDFSRSIELKKTKSADSLDDTYEHRADAYVKVSDFGDAIEDYSRAIGKKFASQVFLMSIAQIRGIYPEFHNISDQDLLEGLRQKYFPNMKPSDFYDQYQKNAKPFEDFVLAGLYEDRGDAYLYARDCKESAEDYARAIHDDSTYTLNRWKVILKTTNSQISMDAQTLDCSENIASLWLRISKSNSSVYDQINYQVNCPAREMKSLAWVRYNSLGRPIRTDGEQEWQVIVPGSTGEIVYNAVCPTHSNEVQ
ncbi:MAG: tetratricopeptide repeat protein [Candidatus Acidiferrales bacterium]